MARAKLEADGVECFLADENLIYLNWFMSNAIGGVRLQLLEDNAEVATDILSQEIPARFNAEEVGEEYYQPICPNCHSLDVSFQENSKASLVFLWLLGLPVPIPRNRWRCEDCANEWKEQNVRNV